MTNGATIEVLSTGQTYHTWKTWNLAMETKNPVGPPDLETYYVDVPGADGFLDYSEALTGRPVFKSRSIEMALGCHTTAKDWPVFVSQIRNLLEGRTVHLIFDDFPGYYYTGRAQISAIERNHHIGTLTLSVPMADPYAYAVEEESQQLIVNNSTEIMSFDSGGLPFPVTVQASGINNLKLKYGNAYYMLIEGVNRFGFAVDPGSSLIFEGTGSVTVIYRRRIL